MKALLSIIAAATGTGAFAAFFFAIWSDQYVEWFSTGALLAFIAWVTGTLASED